MRTQARPQSHARCWRTCSTRGDAMRSLPICKAFLSPFASSCRGSSTLGFVLRVTESDCRRPRSVGVRHDDVRVSVRAVDMLSFGVPVRGVGRLRQTQSVLGCSGGAEELRAGTPAGFGWLGTHSSRVVRAPRRAQSRTGAALPPRRSAGPAPCRARPSAPLSSASRRRPLPRRRLRWFHPKPATLSSASAWRCSLGTLSRHRRSNPCSDNHDTTHSKRP